jgi:hypothetical protein
MPAGRQRVGRHTAPWLRTDTSGTAATVL